MITINKTTRDFTEVEKYLMTAGHGVVSLKDVDDGTVIPVDGVLEFTDTKDNGESNEILSIITPDSKVYACQSATFKRSLGDIINVMNGKPFSVIKCSGKTKAGRAFIDCELDITSIM